MQTSYPWGANLWPNSKFWQFWGLYSHIFAPINVKVGTGERTCGPLPRANFHVYRGNVSPLRGEKPIFGPVSKNNTGMATLRAGLPVIKQNVTNASNQYRLWLQQYRRNWVMSRKLILFGIFKDCSLCFPYYNPKNVIHCRNSWSIWRILWFSAALWHFDVGLVISRMKIQQDLPNLS